MRRSCRFLGGFFGLSDLSGFFQEGVRQCELSVVAGRRRAATIGCDRLGRGLCGLFRERFRLIPEGLRVSVARPGEKTSGYRKRLFRYPLV